MYKIHTERERETQSNESLMYRDRKTIRWRGLDTNNNNKKPIAPARSCLCAKNFTLALSSGQV